MAQVQIIQPYQPQSDALEKVAAYCRVSTESKNQLNSYRTQIGYYTNYIAQHPGWELVDIYADECPLPAKIDRKKVKKTE